MTLDWSKYWWQPGFALGFFAVGLPYWLMPYNTINLPDAVIGYGLLMVMGAAVPAAVMARVVVEGILDSTSHNLWPLEIIIAAVVGGAAGLAGTLLGSVLLWLSRKGRDDEQAG